MHKKLLACALLLFPLILYPSLSQAGEYRVSPVKLYFDMASKSEITTITNTGEDDVTLQMKAFEWFQDENGKDQYVETNDLVYYPRIMPVKRGESRIVRVGIKLPASKKEKTFRIFIEEVPERTEPGKAAVKVSIRFGVPVFAKPPSVTNEGEIESLGLAGSMAETAVRNKGNTHFFIKTVNFTGLSENGETVFSSEQNGWYLLAGAARKYSAEIPEAECSKTAVLRVEVQTDKFNLDKKLDVDKAMCGK